MKRTHLDSAMICSTLFLIMLTAFTNLTSLAIRRQYARCLCRWGGMLSWTKKWEDHHNERSQERKIPIVSVKDGAEARNLRAKWLLLCN